MSRHRSLRAAVFAALCFLPCWAVTAQFELTSRIPAEANAIVLLDIDKVMMSPVAQKEDWRANRERAVAAGLTILPPSATSFAMAAKLDLETMQPIWEVSIATVNYQPSMPKVAARWQGTVDRVAGRNAAILPDDSYVVELGPKKVAAMRPANRQNVARWLQSTDTSGDSNLSPYMQEAIAYSKKLGTPIIMAIDMENMVSVELVKKRLVELKLLEGSNLDLDQVSQILASIRGITLGLNVKDEVSGALIVDFAEDVSMLKGVAKSMLLEVLANRGAMIDEFQTWSEDVSGNRVRITGTLYRSGVQRIFSVLDAPASLQMYAPSLGDEPDEQKTAVLASQQYFKSVSGLVDDLSNKKKTTDVKSSGQVGMWCERYAKKIDALPMLNVDELLLDYGKFVSASLRDAGATLRNVGGRSRVREMNAPGYSSGVVVDGYYGTAYASGTYGAYGNTFFPGYGFDSPAAREEAQNRARIRTEERVSGAQSARSSLQDIAGATVEVRRRMTEKYNAEF